MAAAKSAGSGAGILSQRANAADSLPMRWILCLVGAMACSCAAVPVPDAHAPRPVREVDRWEVTRGQDRVGSVLLLEIVDAAHPSRFYQVQNARGQWLGYVDAHGRVYQRVPFSMTEAFRGIHSMENGLRLLYEESGPLVVSPAGVTEAAARRP